MDIETIRALVRENRFYESRHARNEREADNLTLAEAMQALMSGRIIENYPDTGRGGSCLIAGMADEKPIHVVCAESHFRPGQIVFVTIYIPKPPKFIDPWTRKPK